MPFAIGPQPNFLGGIGDFLGGAVKTIGTMAAGALGRKAARKIDPGPRTVQNIVYNSPAKQALVPAPQAFSSGGPVRKNMTHRASWGPVAVRGARKVVPALAGAGAALVGSGGGNNTSGQIKPILDKARNEIDVPVTSKKIASTIRQFGFEAAGEFFGLDLDELATIWMHTNRRRRRRFTPRDKSRARAYINSLKKCAAELNSLRPRASTARRSSRAGGNTITQVK